MPAEPRMSSHAPAALHRRAWCRCAIIGTLWLAAVATAEDIYESRVTDEFVEETTFRFRTRYNRAFTDNEEFKTLVSQKTDVPPILDGMLEDPCWRVADHTRSAFVQWQTKDPNRKQTVAYVCHDDENLYMAFVCEEPNTKRVKMLSHHPVGKRSWVTAGNGDSIETFIELGGVGGTGQLFQFIFNVYPDVRYYGIVPTQQFVGADYRLGGAFGAKQWVCELAFPYRNFHTEGAQNVDFRYPGAPRRGEVWGLRIVRNGPKPSSGEEQMRSTWTFNPVQAWHIPYPTGIIVFEDRNALRNGAFHDMDPRTNRPIHWNLGRIGDPTDGRFLFDTQAGHAVLSANLRRPEDGLQATQNIGVLPNVGYRLTARIRKAEGSGPIVIGVDRPTIRYEFTRMGEWEEHVVDFFSEPGQREAVVFLRAMGGPTAGTATADIDQVRVEQQIYGAPTGAVCLTGNSPRQDLNVPPEAAQAVRYTYREPGTDKEEFPERRQWAAGWIHGIADEGGTTGWITATQGSLTHSSGRKPIQWTHGPPKSGYVPYPKGHELIFDLGQDYYIRTVELLPFKAIENMTVHVRPDQEDRFLLTSKLRGEGVLNPPGPALFGRLERINSVARHVKVWFLDGGHGIYFARIWGEPKGDRTGVSRFRWKQGLTVPEVKHQQFRKLPGPVLMPTPQEVEWGEGEFVVREGTPVHFRPEGHGERTAEILAQEVYARLGFRLRLVKSTDALPTAAGNQSIVLGESSSPGLAHQLAEARGWTLGAARPGPQGYFLSARPDGILVCGFDQAGTFYGVQTLLQLLVRKDWSSAGARSVEIRDWPYIPWRMIDIRGGVTPPLVRALAQLKVNVIMGRTGTYARLCDDHFMFTMADFANHNAGSPIEMEDDENWHYLGLGSGQYRRICACPSRYQRYEFYEGVAQAAVTPDAASEINLNLDEMDHTNAGARWNADRPCLRRRLPGDELFTEMILRAYDIFRLNHRKTALLDTMMVAGFENGNGDYHNMHLAYDRIPEDIHVYCWRGIPGDPNSDPEEAIRRFERATMLQSSFPLQGRGKLNEFYKPPEGKRVWGVWNTVWGVAGPPEQVLTGQFCRSMSMVDGGCVIPFMTQAWNPDNPAIHAEEWVLKIGHLQQRLGELALERELPSWRDGVSPTFYPIDLRPGTNWSHIDPVPGDGRDWLDWGPNNDLRQMPMGNVEFEEVPFHILNPESNGGRSMVLVANLPENSRLQVPLGSAGIPVGRTAASLIFLRTNLEEGHWPGYRITYTGGQFLTVALDGLGNESRKYAAYGLYAPGQTSDAPDDPTAFYRKARHKMVELYSLFFRPAWLGTTTAGDPVKIVLHEWVNPIPERVIESVSVTYPPGRTSQRMEALFAITGVAPTERDVALWKDRAQLPLVPANEVEIEPTDVPVIPIDGTWAEEGDTPATYLNAQGDTVCRVTGFAVEKNFTNNRNFFKCLDNAHLGPGGRIDLASPQVCRKIALRGLFHWEHHGDRVYYGTTTFRRTDYVLEVSGDGQEWLRVGAKQGICGEDGAHVHRLPQVPIRHVRVKLDGKNYVTERSQGAAAGEGLTWIQLFR